MSQYYTCSTMMLEQQKQSKNLFWHKRSPRLIFLGKLLFFSENLTLKVNFSGVYNIYSCDQGGIRFSKRLMKGSKYAAKQQCILHFSDIFCQISQEFQDIFDRPSSLSIRIKIGQKKIFLSGFYKTCAAHWLF